MKTEDILKIEEFEKVTQVKPDSRNRINLTKAVEKAIIAVSGDTIYRVYINAIGQIILDPQVTIPAHEAWLFKNNVAKQAVQKGIRDARSKRLIKGSEDYSKYLDDKAA